MEDDMEILRWPSRAVLGDPPPGWGALQLYMLGNSANQLYRSPPGRWVPWAPGLFNTGAYIINRTGMQRVRALLGSRAMSEVMLGVRSEVTRRPRLWQSLKLRSCSGLPWVFSSVFPGDCLKMKMVKNPGWTPGRCLSLRHSCCHLLLVCSACSPRV